MFGSIREVKAANKRAGRDWFSRGTMSFFGSRVEGRLVAGRFFVASSCMEEGVTQRKHSVHHAAPDGTITTPSGFHRFADARRWLKIALRDGLAAAEAEFADVRPQVRAFPDDVAACGFPEPG